MEKLILPNPEEPRIRLATGDAEAKWGPEMLVKAQHALDRAEQRLGLKLNCQVLVISCRSEFEFERFINARITHVVAVALPSRCEVVIQRAAWFAEDSAQQEQVLVHEMTHLIIGRRVAGRLPAWLNEGLAMVTAGQEDFENSWRVLVAGTLGGLLPLEALEDDFAFTGSTQDLAYAESLALTRFYIQRALPDQSVAPDNPAPLAKALADPRTGPMLLNRLWDPNFRMALDAQWRQSQRSLWSWLAFFSGTSVLWIYITLLFLLAYWRKRRMAQLIHERFAEEDNRDAEFGADSEPWMNAEHEGEMDDENDR